MEDDIDMFRVVQPGDSSDSRDISRKVFKKKGREKYRCDRSSVALINDVVDRGGEISYV